MTDIEKKESNESLVKQNSIHIPESIDSIDISDLRLPSVFICQALSQKAQDNGVPHGSMYDSITFESFESMILIMCYKFETRILYGQNISDQLQCYSQDGKVPSSPNPIHNECISCPENILPLEKIEKGKSKYGKCNRTYNFCCIKPGIEEGDENDFPFIIPMQRTNAPMAKNIINYVIRKRQELFGTTKKIFVKSIVSDKGRYYQYDIEHLVPTDEKDINRARYWMNFMKSMLAAQRYVIGELDDSVATQVTPF